MSKILIKIIFLFKVDLLLRYFRNMIHISEIHRIEKKCGCTINFVSQGFNGIQIMTTNGDYTKFFIHKTSHLKSDTIIDCSGGVTIGRYFHTGRGLTIFSTNHNYSSDRSIPYDDEEIIRPVKIGDFVWCGANVTIVPGVVIGEGVVIGSGSVVTRDVPPHAIIGGNPAKVINYRNSEIFNKLKSEKKFF